MKFLHIAIAGTALLLPSVSAAQSRFEWATGDFAGQSNARVAMLVPVLIGQRLCHMQLDTGMPRLAAWHEYSGDNLEPQPIDIQFAGHQVTMEASKAVRELVARCQPGAPVGSLGNEFFEKGTLCIDLKSRRISYQVGSTLGADRNAAPFFYSKSAQGGGHVVIEVGLGDEKGLALLDTGAAALDLGVFRDGNWNRLTRDALLQRSEHVAVFEVHAWGRQHQCFKTQSTVPIRIASGRGSHPFVTYCPTIGPGFSADLVGGVGMNPFIEDEVVIDYPLRRWTARRSTAKVD